MDRATLYAVAGAAEADPRSVERVLKGERLRGMVDARIRRVLDARRIPYPAPDSKQEARATQRAELDRAMGLSRPVRGPSSLRGSRQVLCELDEDTARRLNARDDGRDP